MIYLASKSPRRTELLQQIGVEHQILDIEVDEDINSSNSPQENVRALSVLKCQEGVRKVTSESKSTFPILAADTIVVLEDKIFGKPQSESDAISMLLKLSGKTHLVMTGVTVGVITTEQAKFHTISVASNVEFAKLTESDCKEYCKTNEPFDKAGGYGIQGYGSAFIKKINGSYSNIVGLPIHEVVKLLKELGIPYWNKK
jgi:septum formation protein|tara:strand:- start:3060 stop:3659 length:600 start_codon:yes stop_codon:yes gene_type:complete